MKIALALIVLLVGYNLWEVAWEGFFYQCIAVAFVLLFWEVYRKGIFARIGFWLSISNLVDEIFFDPTLYGINEILFAIIIITLETWQEIRAKRKQSSG